MEATILAVDEDLGDVYVETVQALPKEQLGALLSRIALVFDFDSWQFAALEEADRRLTQQE